MAPKGTQIGSITACWVLPKARPWNNSGKAPYQAAMWVGIDGDAKYGQSKPGLWQTGVYEIATKDLKIPEYVLFYEMVPGKIQFYTTDGQPLTGRTPSTSSLVTGLPRRSRSTPAATTGTATSICRSSSTTTPSTTSR